MIKINKLNKSFIQADKKIEVIKDLSIELEENKSLSIVGPSGSGKSTLLSLMAGLDKPTSGEILINEKNISTMSEKESINFRGQNIGIIFQQFHLMPHLNALENVLLALEINKVTDAKMKASLALEKVGLASRLDHLPSQLSGGEKQRVAIARAICTNPKILLADEPSGNLDVKTGENVMNLIFDLVDELKTTFILITHDENLAGRCQNKYSLQNGILNAVN